MRLQWVSDQLLYITIFSKRNKTLKITLVKEDLENEIGL